MNDDDDDYDDNERQLRNLEQASAVVSHRIERVDPIFNHAINTLWAGNGTASLAVLGAISATSKNGVIDKRTLLPLALFLAGLIFRAATCNRLLNAPDLLLGIGER